MTWTDREREGFELNRASWDERVDAHWRSQMYRRHAEDLRAGGQCLDAATLQHVGDVNGRSLIHLQCHMGMETLSLARLGADAVGVDFSQPAIDKANLLRDELGLAARFVCANVYDAVETVGRTFDVVFVSVGALCWLPDVARWANVVGQLLKPGGRLYLNESHPFGDIFGDDESEPPLLVKHPYLDDPGQVFDEDGTYADTTKGFSHTRTMSWTHPLGVVVTSLIRAGLRIDLLEESSRCCWPRYGMMTQTEPDNWELPGPALGKLPMTYTLLAHKAD